MADCTNPAKTGIPEALGLKTFTMGGERWVVGVEAARALGYSSPDALMSRVRIDPQFVRGRDWRVVRGQQCLQLSRAVGLSGYGRALTVLTEDLLAIVVDTRQGKHGDNARALAISPRAIADVPMAPSAPSDRLGLAHRVFEGHDVATINMGGRECWIALDVGRALEYGDGGKALLRAVVQDWASDFCEGEHYVVAKGEILKEIKAVVNLGGDTPRVDARAPSLMMLTKAGLWMVLDKTTKPVGVTFRRWLSGEVREAAEQGRAVATGMNGEALPAPAPVSNQLAFDFGPSEADMARERRLLTQANHRHEEAGRKLDLEASKLDLEVGKLQVGFAEKVVGWDLTDPLKREVVAATAKAIGLDVKGVK